MDLEVPKGYNRSWYYVWHSTGDPSVVGYVDLDDRKSTTGYVFTFGGGFVC